MNSCNSLNSANFENYSCIVLLTFMESCGVSSQKIICSVSVNIINGYLISLFMHGSTLSTNTNSYFSSKVQQDARCHGRTHYHGNIILASGNQKYPMSQTTWPTSSHMAYITMSWETLTMCSETWCSFDLNTIKFNGLYKHRCEVVKLWFSQDMVMYAMCDEVGHVVWDIGYFWLPDARIMFSW